MSVKVLYIAQWLLSLRPTHKSPYICSFMNVANRMSVSNEMTAHRRRCRQRERGYQGLQFMENQNKGEKQPQWGLNNRPSVRRK